MEKITKIGRRPLITYLVEGDIEIKVGGGDVAEVRIDRPNFDIVTMPEITVEGKVSYEIVFDGSFFTVKLINEKKRTARVKVSYKVYAYKVWR